MGKRLAGLTQHEDPRNCDFKTLWAKKREKNKDPVGAYFTLSSGILDAEKF
jgi:hypothetical protein